MMEASGNSENKSIAMSVFDFDDYRQFLQCRVGNSNARTGERVRIAQFIRVHPSYITLVLQDRADLSLEAAVNLNRYFGHSDLEGEYFLCLVEKARAGTLELKGRYERRLGLLLVEHAKECHPARVVEDFPQMESLVQLVQIGSKLNSGLDFNLLSRALGVPAEVLLRVLRKIEGDAGLE